MLPFALGLLTSHAGRQAGRQADDSFSLDDFQNSLFVIWQLRVCLTITVDTQAYMHVHKRLTNVVAITFFSKQLVLQIELPKMLLRPHSVGNS